MNQVETMGEFQKQHWSEDVKLLSVDLELFCSACWTKIQLFLSRLAGDELKRNLAMEKVTSTVMFSCNYSNSGCPVTLLHTDKTVHEDIC
jgi:hypothetical protein